MKWALVALNEKTIKKALAYESQLHEHISVDVYGNEKYGNFPIKTYTGKLKHFSKTLFDQYDVIIYMMAMGIVVRDITPYMIHKSMDPAVLCLSPDGQFIIPVLSGHLGGANEAAYKLSNLLGMTPVITTASDVFGKKAVDMIAKEHHLTIKSFEMAKQVTTLLIDEYPVEILSDRPIKGLKTNQLLSQEAKGSIDITYRVRDYKIPTAVLIPKELVLGIGARRGTTYEAINSFLSDFCSDIRVYKKAINRVASIDLKADELGIIDLSTKLEADFITYSSDTLGTVAHQFEGSEFVKKITGVSSVCEPSGYLASGGGRCIGHKRARDGITLSLWEVNPDDTCC